MSEENVMSLADIAGVNLDNVEEFRFENLPVGAYTFQVDTSGLIELGQNDSPAAEVKVKVLETHGLVGLSEGESEADYVGKEHREVFFIKEAKDIGRIKAFLVDVGFQSSGALGDLLSEFEGHIFQGRIKHRADKHDKSIKYANIVTEKKGAQKDA